MQVRVIVTTVECVAFNAEGDDTRATIEQLADDYIAAGAGSPVGTTYKIEKGE